MLCLFQTKLKEFGVIPSPNIIAISIFWICLKWNKTVQSCCATIFSQMCISSFGDLLIYILHIKVLFQREEVGKGWRGRKRILSNISQFTQNVVKCWVPVSFRAYILAFVSKHMLFQSLQNSLLVGTSHSTFDQVARSHSKLSGSLHFLYEPMQIRPGGADAK